MVAQLQQAYRLKVRVGESEFDAEGPEDTVNAQYERFLQAIEGGGSNGKPKEKRKECEQESDGDEALEIGQETWDRFYSLEGEDNVSLKVLPSSQNQNVDALILLLYGYLHLRQKDTVPAAPLLRMAKKSGVGIDRIDRSIPADHNRYINKGGSRRGTRYSLNNQGQNYAQQLLETEAER